MTQPVDDLRSDLIDLLSGHLDHEGAALLQGRRWVSFARWLLKKRPALPNQPQALKILRLIIISERRPAAQIVGLRKGIGQGEKRAKIKTGSMLGPGEIDGL